VKSANVSQTMQTVPAARIPGDSSLRSSCLPTPKRKPDGQAQCTHEDTPGTIWTRSWIEPHAWIYTHAVEEDDRLVAEQLGEMLCPNVAKLAQEKTFAVGEGV